MMETSGYLEKIKMSYADAQKICSSVVEGRIRWGKLYDAGAIPTAQLCDALVVLAHTENSKEAELRKELATANRRLAAANAREQKYKKALGREIEEDDAGE
jgi:hypothetical protein